MNYKKTIVQQALRLSIYDLNKIGAFNRGYAKALFKWPHGVQMTAVIDPEGLYMDLDGQSIRLETMACYFGGVRYWFICPACGRQAATLFITLRSRRLACRLCHNLSYDSQNESKLLRRGHRGWFIAADSRREKLLDSIKRWTWGGRPTKKARQYYALEKAVSGINIDEMLRK